MNPKRIFICLFALVFAFNAHSQDLSKFKLYTPTDNAEEGIANAVKQAKATGKNVFIQIGGNWCIWCARFHEFVTTDKSLDSMIKANYVVYHLNWSKENKNEALLTKYEFPQRFGFPVFLVLNGEGRLIHTQDSGLLEQDKGYSKNKVMTFLSSWSPSAFDPKQYKEQ